MEETFKKSEKGFKKTEEKTIELKNKLIKKYF